MNKPNLVLHCGATEVGRTALSDIILPPATRTYCPLGHDTFVDMVEDRLGEVGFRFGVQAHSLTKEGNRYFGLCELVCGQENEQHAMVLGIRNSIDKSFPAALAFGSQVFVCDNLAFSGEIKVSRKHTTNIMRDLPFLITAAVSNTKIMKQNQELRFERYQEVSLRGRTADHLIIEMVRHGAINTSRVEKVVQQWDEPDHDFGGRTAWRLFNAATEALKEAPLHDVPLRTIALQSIMDKATKFTPQAIIEGEYEVVQ